MGAGGGRMGGEREKDRVSKWRGAKEGRGDKCGEGGRGRVKWREGEKREGKRRA